jgi:hypothetical protein
MRWIDTTGGPLVVIENHLITAWRGSAEFPAPGTDYSRACDVTGYLGVIPVGEGAALVLGDEPMATAWWPDQRWGGGLIVRWMYAPDESAVLRHLAALPPMEFAEPVAWPVQGDSQMLFDSALTGTEASDSGVELSLRIGAYRVGTHVFKPDDDVCLVLHRVRREEP